MVGFAALARPVWEGKMSTAPVWLWGGTSRPARKTALTEASLCVIVALEDGVVGVGVGAHTRICRRGESLGLEMSPVTEPRLGTPLGNQFSCPSLDHTPVIQKLFMLLFVFAWAKLMQLTGSGKIPLFESILCNRGARRVKENPLKFRTIRRGR